MRVISTFMLFRTSLVGCTLFFQSGADGLGAGLERLVRAGPDRADSEYNVGPVRRGRFGSGRFVADGAERGRAGFGGLRRPGSADLVDANRPGSVRCESARFGSARFVKSLFLPVYCRFARFGSGRVRRFGRVGPGRAMFAG